MASEQHSEYLTLKEAPLPFTILVTVLGGVLAAAVALGGKILDVFGATPAATVLAYSVTFVCTDCISELYGRRRANQAVAAGFIAMILATALYMLALEWPGASWWENQEAFETVFGAAWRITLGGAVAYLISQFHDVWAFHFWRGRTKGKHLWLRNNLSTMTSQALDTAVFITIAFAGVFPILPVMIGHYLVKLAIAVIDTPVLYLIVSWVRASHSPRSNTPDAPKT